MARIYIEASSLYGKRSGVGRYNLSLIESLLGKRRNDSFKLFSFLRPGRSLRLDFTVPSNASVHFIRWFPGSLFSFLMRHGIALPLELFSLQKADVLFFPNFIAWQSLTRKKRIVVVHDIAFRFYPEFIQAKNLAYLRAQLPRSLLQASAVVVNSASTKKDLMTYYHVPAEKITVVHGAADSTIFNPSAQSRVGEVKTRYAITENYLLFVGNLEPRKNLEGLLRAYADSYSKHRLALVIVGAKGWNDSGIEQGFSNLRGLPIYRTDFVSDSDLAALYAGATAFVFPSFYEGVGIPCLEAMACGCPVICSNNSSLPEAVGDAAVLIDPANIQELAEAIVDVVSNEKKRAVMRNKGFVQSQKFTWEKGAGTLSRLIDQVLGYTVE